MLGKELWNELRKDLSSECVELSSFSSACLKTDVKHFLFAFARYKFVLKMIANRKNINLLELGCNDGLGTLLFKQSGFCKSITGVDFDAESITWAKKNIGNTVDFTFIEDDFLGKEYMGVEKADVVVSLDVIEHIEQSKENIFLETICKNLKETGFAVIGTPNIAMYNYTSDINKKAHINNYNQERLYNFLSQKFNNVFIFGMNDEVLHTGFNPMSCYILALCCNKIV